jgi:hypothetical protein
MIMLSFLFVVLFFTMAQIVLVTRQLDNNDGLRVGGEAGFYGAHNSMGVQLRRSPNSMVRIVPSVVVDKNMAVVETHFDSKVAHYNEPVMVPNTPPPSQTATFRHVDLDQDKREDDSVEETTQNPGINADDDDETNNYENSQVEPNRKDDDLIPVEEFHRMQQEEGEEALKVEAASSSSSLSQQLDVRCAINLFGLPRSFASLVLPSMITNVIKPNRDYHCDYFVHYYNVTSEAPGRSGAGGDIDPNEILLLEQAVAAVYDVNGTSSSSSSSPSRIVVRFISDSDNDFQAKYGEFLNMVHTTQDSQGRLLYFPWKSSSYTSTSVNNIVKMWHSIDSVWQLMQDYAKRHSIEYTRVAMLRSDVVYVTPIDIWVGKNPSIMDTENRQVVIPGFGRHPVSDRIVYGPYDAVQEWAANRFSSLADHVDLMLKEHPGQGMHR